MNLDLFYFILMISASVLFHSFKELGKSEMLVFSKSKHISLALFLLLTEQESPWEEIRKPAIVTNTDRL